MQPVGLLDKLVLLPLNKEKSLLLHSLVERKQEHVPVQHKSALLLDQQKKLDAAATPSRKAMLEEERERVVQLYRWVHCSTLCRMP